jgi:hypothetical protein
MSTNYNIFTRKYEEGKDHVRHKYRWEKYSVCLQKQDEKVWTGINWHVGGRCVY